MKICFATRNPNKIKEVRMQLGDQFTLLSLEDIGCHEEIPEEGNSLEQNSMMKALYIKDHYDVDCFAEDSGLEVDALDGEPGVFSARYAGTPKDDQANLELLLRNMKSHTHRKARFRAVVTLVINGKISQFAGNVEGEIGYEPRGTGGFGYDPVFIPEGYTQTFAELPMSLKQKMGHRGKAMRQLIAYLSEKDPTEASSVKN